MEKLVYLTRNPAASPAEYRRQMLDEIAPRVLEAGAVALTAAFNDLQEEIPKPMLLLGEGASLGAAISLWIPSLDDRGPIEAAIAEGCARFEGFLVTESIPQPCEGRDWADGERSPGVTHFTWFAKAPGVTDEDFYRNWHEVHTPFSFELHPLRCEYVRDAVVRSVTPGAESIRAIVGERFNEIRDYTDPRRLFGSKEVLKRSAEEAGDYGDPDRMHSAPLSEYILRTAPWARR